ncbi:F-box protein At3g07870-like [Papaver somniferum]|uniref:F-box protein At3g07870-like n=1 Tax=Papaver somniferum TaxID=3469 RepID=UPI000E6FDC0B|nr:F-box protein At3g07870-like [Papaver somniferum]
MGTIYNLPEDIVLDMLNRLPVETVLECKLVCKPWKDVVHHPSFPQKHLNHHLDDSDKLNFIFSNLEQDPEELYYAEYDEDYHEVPFNRNVRINLSPLFYKYGCSLAGSCNGLICFNSYYEGYYGPVYICNPITREYVILPEFEGQCWWTVFGYIPSTNEYKVVRICETGGDSNFGIVQV